MPGRSLDEISDEAREHLVQLSQNSAPTPIANIDRAAENLQRVFVQFNVCLQRHVSELGHEVDLGPLRFVFMQDGVCWIAQCLEYDLGGEGATPQEAAAAVFDAIAARIALDRVLGRAPLAGVPEAPEKYKRLYAQGKPLDIEPPQQDIDGDFRVAA